MKLQGFVHKFGDNIDTDVIIPARYLKTSDPSVLASHLMNDIFPDFAASVKTGDIIVGGENFGCGSSREHAPIAIKGCGISCIIAKSFARIFYRNSINIGLPVFECPEAAEGIEPGDRVEIAPSTGIITDLTNGLKFAAEPVPEEIRRIIEAGGAIASLRIG